MAGRLELDDLQGHFQRLPFYDSKRPCTPCAPLHSLGRRRQSRLRSSPHAGVLGKGREQGRTAVPTTFVSEDRRRAPSGPARQRSVPVCSHEPSEHRSVCGAAGCASPTCLPFAHDQAGVVKNLFLIIMVDHFALAKIGCYAGRIDHRDQLHPEVLQVIPTCLIIIFFQHVGK